MADSPKDERPPRQVLIDFLNKEFEWENPLTQKPCTATALEHLIATAWVHAMGGKSNYFTQILDRVIGKEPVQVRHSGPDGQPLKLYDGVNPTEWDEPEITDSDASDTEHRADGSAGESDASKRSE